MFCVYGSVDGRTQVLDTTSETEEQLDWLKAQLSLGGGGGGEGRSTIICSHIPPFIEYWDPVTWNSPTAPEHGWGNYMRLRVIPVVEASPVHEAGLVKMVISGHSHLYQRGERNGVQYESNQKTCMTDVYLQFWSAVSRS